MSVLNPTHADLQDCLTLIIHHASLSDERPVPALQLTFPLLHRRNAHQSTLRARMRVLVAILQTSPRPGVELYGKCS
jgi:hypothetical protein